MPQPSDGSGFDALALGSATTGCAAGRGRITCTTDAGHTWHTRYGGVAAITQLQFVTPDDGWVVAPGLLLSTTTGGRGWRQRARVPSLRAVDFVTASDGWAITMRGLLETHTGGTRWTSVPTPGTIRAIDFLTPRTGWLLDQSGEILHTTTSGRTWTRQWTAPIGASWTMGRAEIFFTSPTTGWVLLTLGQACLSQEPYVVYHTYLEFDSAHQRPL